MKKILIGAIVLVLIIIGLITALSGWTTLQFEQSFSGKAENYPTGALCQNDICLRLSDTNSCELLGFADDTTSPDINLHQFVGEPVIIYGKLNTGPATMCTPNILITRIKLNPTPLP